MAGDHGALSPRHAVAVAQVVVFTLSLAFAVYFKTKRHNGWFCIGVFSIFRIVGAGCMLGTITNNSKSVWAGVFVCESFGVVLVAFLVLEFLERAYVFPPEPSSRWTTPPLPNKADMAVSTRNRVVPTLHPRWFLVPQVITWADMALAIGGFAAASKRENALAPTAFTQASYGLFLGLYFILLYIWSTFWRARATFPYDERLAIYAASAILPLLAVRTAYSVVFQITGDMAWNAVQGNSTIYLVMTFLPEAFLIALSIVVIMMIHPPPPKKKNGEAQAPASGYTAVGLDRM